MRTIFLIALLTACVTAYGSVPPMINYQGKLMQPSGAPVPDGTYSMVFAIYDAPTGGTALWSETNPSVQVKGGLFAVLLGSVNNLGSNLFDSPNRFFGVKVGTDPEMTPRQQIASVGYAVKASAADTAALATTVLNGAITQDKLADGAITESKLANGAVAAAKIADGSVTSAKIAPGSVNTSGLASGGVTQEKLADAAVGASKLVPLEAWIAPVLNSGWQNYNDVYGGDYSVAGFCKDILGFVHIRGLIATAQTSGIAFTLPAGYRPNGTCIYAARSYGNTGRVDVHGNGEVHAQGLDGWVSLEGITFHAEP